MAFDGRHPTFGKLLELVFEPDLPQRNPCEFRRTAQHMPELNGTDVSATQQVIGFWPWRRLSRTE